MRLRLFRHHTILFHNLITNGVYSSNKEPISKSSTIKKHINIIVITILLIPHNGFAGGDS